MASWKDPPPRFRRILSDPLDPELELEESKNRLFWEHWKPSWFAKLSKSIKTMSFFEKVKIFVDSCHEKTLVIPENEKLNFVKHSFTTEFSHRNTTFLTEIPTVLDVWTLYFQYFQKRWNFDFQNLFMQFTFTGNFRNQCFWDGLLPFLLLSDMVLSLNHTGPSWGAKLNFLKRGFHDWISSSWHHLTD